MAAGWTLVAMQVSGLLLEAPLLALTARWPKRALIAGSMAAVGLFCAAGAMAPSYTALLVALSLYGLSLGMATSLSQAALVDIAGDDRERMLSRWALHGAIGDVGGPLLVGGLALVGAGWRVGLASLSVLAVAQAALIFRGPEVRAAACEEEDEGEGEAARGPRKGGGVRAVVFWCCAGVLCALLDEVLLGFAALRLDELGATPAERGLVLVACVVGEIAGLAAVEWAWSRIHPIRVLLLSAGGCAVAYVAWLNAGWLPASAALFFVVGLFAAPLFPVLSAQAFAALPGRSTTVSAISAVVSGVELAVPVLIGLVADRWGLRAALAALLLAPVGLFAVAAGVLASGRARDPRVASPG